MPISNLFDRTAIFYRENGRRIKRIPWDLIGFTESSGGCLISPMPMAANMFGETATTTISSDIYDMLQDDGQNNLIDEVTDIMWFESEAAFISKFENVFGFYDQDDVSGQFGYPCL